MAGNKKPRKKYRPGRGAILDPIAFLSKLPTGGLAATQSSYHWAMKKLVAGEGTVADWRLVAASINVASVLDEKTFDGAYADEMAEAMLAHQRCGARAITHQRFLYKGAEISAVNFALEVHDEQLKSVTRRELELATEEVRERSKHPQNRMSPVALAGETSQGNTQ